MDDATFEQFWIKYPRKTAKLDALKAWKALKPDAETVTAILQALDWQVHQPSWRRDQGQYIPYPASWLRGGRWMDEPEPDDRRVVRHEENWWDECKRIHNGACDLNRMRHYQRKEMDAYKEQT